MTPWEPPHRENGETSKQLRGKERKSTDETTVTSPLWDTLCWLLPKLKSSRTWNRVFRLVFQRRTNERLSNRNDRAFPQFWMLRCSSLDDGHWRVWALWISRHPHAPFLILPQVPWLDPWFFFLQVFMGDAILIRWQVYMLWGDVFLDMHEAHSGSVCWWKRRRNAANLGIHLDGIAKSGELLGVACRVWLWLWCRQTFYVLRYVVQWKAEGSATQNVDE